MKCEIKYILYQFKNIFKDLSHIEIFILSIMSLTITITISVLYGEEGINFYLIFIGIFVLIDFTIKAKEYCKERLI